MLCPVSDSIASHARVVFSCPQISMNEANYSIFPNARLMVSGSLVGGWQAVPVQR
jgi:hypothetical protein